MRVLLGGSNLMAAIAVTDLPDPDSPTSARISPRLIENEIPRRAVATPEGVSNPRVRPSISSKVLDAVIKSANA